MIAIILIIIIGANMNAIFITKGSKYDCNLKLRFSIPNRSINDWNLSQLGPNMIAMSKIVLRSGLGWVEKIKSKNFLPKWFTP